MSKLSALLPILALAVPAAAADTPGGEARARAVAPYLDEQTIGLVHVEVTRIPIDALADHLTRSVRLPAQAVAPLRDVARQWVADFTKAGGKDLYLLMSLADLPGGPFLVVPLGDGVDGRALAALLGSEKTAKLAQHLLLPVTPGTVAVLDRAVVAGSPETLARLRAGKAIPRPEVAQAFAAAGTTAVQVLLLPSADTRRAIREIFPALPREVGDGPSTVVTRGLVWAALGLDTPPDARLHLVIQSRDAAAAQAFRAFLGRLGAVLGHLEPVRRLAAHGDRLGTLLMPRVAGDRLKLSLDRNTPEIGRLLVAAGGSLAEAADRAQCQNNLKQIGLAFHNCHDAHGSFPAVANFDQQGRPLLSWRVHLLPFLGQEKLYREFHLDEPWDSAHNRKLIPRMPAVYRCPSLGRNLVGKTSYLAPVGPALMFTGTPQTVQVKDVTDSTANTIFVVDADDAHAVVWTRPEDLRIDPKNPEAGLVGHHPGGFLALFVDASVHFLPQGMNRHNLYALFTRNGGEAVWIP